MKKTIIAGIIITLSIGRLFGGELLELGSKAPDFSAHTDEGREITLSSIVGNSNIVLIFYPGDNTPGCTSQLCAVRDDWDQFKVRDVAVFGINPASAVSHRNFSRNYNFPFPLLVDKEKKIAEDYKAVGMIFVSRTVYGINKDGIIVFAERGMPDNEKILKAFEQNQ